MTTALRFSTRPDHLLTLSWGLQGCGQARCQMCAHRRRASRRGPRRSRPAAGRRSCRAPSPSAAVRRLSATPPRQADDEYSGPHDYTRPRPPQAGIVTARKQNNNAAVPRAPVRI